MQDRECEASVASATSAEALGVGHCKPQSWVKKRNTRILFK